jgi:hypothetical protein
MSVNSTTAGIVLTGLNKLLRKSRRSSGTLTTPVFGLIVANG